MSQSQSSFSSAIRRLRRTGPALVIAIVFLLFLCSKAGLAQAASGQAAGVGEQGSVAGVVTDANGGKISGATVILKNVENGTEVQVKSSETGEYEFPSVIDGNYIVIVKADGFSTADSDPFQIAANIHQRVDIPLSVQGSTQTVEVNAAATALQTETSDRGQAFETTEMQNLPLADREYTDLSLLNPGASWSSLEMDPIEPRRGSFHMNGMRSSVNNFMLDDLDNNSYQNGALGYSNQIVTPSTYAVQNMTIVSTNFPAEYGRSGGSIVSTTTRSGTDRIRLVVWEYCRNTALDAYGPLYELGHKPQLSNNEFGGTLGGPILRDKLFFFLNEESYRISNNTYYVSTIPTLQQRAGEFYDQTGLPIPMGNPYTDVEYADGVIPSSQFTPLATAIFAALPQPTNSGYYYNYDNEARGQSTRDIGELRLDWSASPRLVTFARYSQQMNHILPATAIEGLAGGYGDGHIYTVTNQVAVGATYTVNAKSLLELRFGVSRVDSGRRPYYLGQPNIYNTLGIPYPVTPQVGTTSLNTQDIVDDTELGTEPSTSIYQNPFTVDFKPSYRMEHSRHSTSFGYELLVLKTPTAWQSPVYGEDVYDGHFSKQESAPATSTLAGDQEYYIADFLFGARSEFELSNYSRLTQNMRFHSAYAEDNWKLAPRLTLNYGLRYEFTVPDFESGNHLANFDPTTDSLKLAQAGSYASRALVNPQKSNFAPRFGFALAPIRNVVVRGGYGLSYIQFNRTGDVALEYNGPYSITTIIQQDTPENNECPVGSQSFVCFQTAMDGYPSNMISALQFSTQNSESYYVPPNTPTGYDQSYYFGIQYQIASHSLFDVAYVGSHAVHVRVISDYNWAPPESIANEGILKLRRPIPTFADIWTALPAGFLKYNSLQAKLEERWNRFFFMNSFDYSQARDNASGDLEASNGDTAIVNFDNIKGDSGISGYNQPLNDSAALTMYLPRARFRERILRSALDQWRFNIINHVTSGLPLNLYWGPTSSASTTNIGYHYRANVCVAGSVLSATGTCPAALPQSILNPKSEWQRLGDGQYVGSVFNTNMIVSPTNQYPYGNVPRNSIRFVPIWSMDAGLAKEFHVRDRGVIQFEGEAFNAPNKTNWNAPNMDVSSGSFGLISTFLPARQFQLSIRYSY